MARVYVGDSLNQDLVTEAVQFFARVLNIADDVVVRVGQAVMPPTATACCSPFDPERHSVGGHEADGDGGYIIFFNLDPFAMLHRSLKGDIEILAHEMVHVAQLASGRLELDFDSESLLFDQVEYFENTPESPWEIEAHALEGELYKMFVAFKRAQAAA